MPKLDWHLEENDNRIVFGLTSDVAPATVRKWTSKADTRDFRKAEWWSSKVESDGDARKFVVTLDRPKGGFCAAFLEAEFAGQPLPFVLTTTLHVFASDKAADSAAGSGSQ